MPRTPSSSPIQAPRNRLLARLPAAEFDRFGRHLQPVPLGLGQILQDWSEPPEHAFFIEAGGASLQARTASDQPIEVGFAGRMDVIGLPVVLGTRHAPLRAIVHIPGTALRIGADHLRAAMTRSRAVRQLLLGYVQAMMVQHAQLVLCNTRHGTEHRVARWLALALDHLDGEEIPITHDVLSRILGVRRASVTTAVGQIVESGILSAQRGSVRVVDRRKLNALACGCREIIRSEYDGMLAVACL